MTLLEFSRLLCSTDVAVRWSARPAPHGMNVAMELSGPGGHRSLLFQFQNGERHQGQHLEEAILHAIDEVHRPVTACPAPVATGRESTGPARAQSR